MTGWCLREVLLSALVATVLLLGGARLFGVHSTAVSSDGPDLSPHRLAAPDVSPASGRIAPIQSERLDAPIIGSGQPWLDRLGIPRGALSHAIESAVSAQESDGRDN